jgi:ABC-2 type transport system permease protein
VSKTFLILKHEFRQTIKRKGFIIMTLAFPVLGLITIGIVGLIQGIEKQPDPGDEVAIGYVDEMGRFADFTSQPGVNIITYTTQEEATSALLVGDVSEYFIISPEYMSTGLIARYITEKELEPSDSIRRAIRNFLLSNLLQGQTNPQITERVKAPLALVSTRLSLTGEVATDQGGLGAFLVPFMFSILLIVSVFSSSGYLLQGLSEEKENRIIEILLSSVSARQLLAGKVLGLGAIGLVQIVIWLLSIVFLVNMASTTIGGVLNTLQIPANFLILGIVYFILGYFFFAVIMAGVGALGATTRESQQLSMIFIFPAIVPIYVFIFSQFNPNHVLTQVLTLIPFTAPTTVFMRLGLFELSTWELIVSIILLVISIIVALVLAAKIFRTFLLMYGKRPRLSEIIKRLREA